MYTHTHTHTTYNSIAKGKKKNKIEKNPITNPLKNRQRILIDIFPKNKKWPTDT